MKTLPTKNIFPVSLKAGLSAVLLRVVSLLSSIHLYNTDLPCPTLTTISYLICHSQSSVRSSSHSKVTVLPAKMVWLSQVKVKQGQGNQ